MCPNVYICIIKGSITISKRLLPANLYSFWRTHILVVSRAGATKILNVFETDFIAHSPGSLAMGGVVIMMRLRFHRKLSALEDIGMQPCRPTLSWSWWSPTEAILLQGHFIHLCKLYASLDDVPLCLSKTVPVQIPFSQHQNCTKDG